MGFLSGNLPYISHHPLDFSSPFELLIDFFFFCTSHPLATTNTPSIVSSANIRSNRQSAGNCRTRRNYELSGGELLFFFLCMSPNISLPHSPEDPPPTTPPLSPPHHHHHPLLSLPTGFAISAAEGALTHVTHAVTGYLNVSRQATETDWLLVLICTKHSIAVTLLLPSDSRWTLQKKKKEEDEKNLDVALHRRSDKTLQ